MNPSVAEHLRVLEESHLKPIVRGDLDELAGLLHESYTEIGASGNVYTRDDVLEHLPSETKSLRTMDCFEARLLSDDVALTTYVVMQTDLSTGAVKRSRRSSVWCGGSGGWRLRFHQGTPL